MLNCNITKVSFLYNMKSYIKTFYGTKIDILILDDFILLK